VAAVRNGKTETRRRAKMEGSRGWEAKTINRRGNGWR